jgi:class 3 adenylate cyclase
VALLGYSVGLLLLQASAERREARRLADHLASFLPRGLAQDIATQTPSGDSLGKPCQGVLLALRVAGLERWTSSVDSLQALAMVHAVSTVAERSAQRHGGALEHLQGETLLMAWSHADANGVHAAIATAIDLGRELDHLLRRNETERYPLGVRAAIESGAFLLGVAGSRTSRRPVLLGPTADAVLAMLALSDELASPLLVGDQAASAQPGDTLQPLGCFLLPDHPRPKQLYRVVE